MSDGHHSGVGALVRVALHFEEELGAVILNFGRSACAPAGSCLLEVAGTHLVFHILFDGQNVNLAAVPLDNPSPPEHIVRLPDTAAGGDSVSPQAFRRPHSTSS